MIVFLSFIDYQRVHRRRVSSLVVYCFAVCLFCLIVTVFFADFVVAAESTPAVDSATTVLEEIAVIGRVVPADEVDTTRQPGFISVIARDEILTRVGTVADVLANQSSIQVRDTGGMGAFSTLYLRGSSAQQVNVYLDGVLLNNVVSGTVDLGRISLNQIEAIEIYRGAPPVQFAHSAIGGAVNIRSKPINKENSAELSLGIGSFDTLKVNLSGAYLLTPRLGVQAAIGYQGSDNDFEFDNDNQTPLNPYDDTVENRNNNQVAMFNGLMSGHYHVSESQTIQLRIQRHQKEQHIPDLFNSIDTRSALDSDLTQVQLYLNDNAWFQGAYALGVFYGRVTEHFHDRQGRIGLGRQDERSLTNTLGAALTGQQLWREHWLTASVELKWDDYKNRQIIGDRSDQTFDRYSATLAVQDDYAFVDESVIWQAGARVHGIRDSGERPDEDALVEVNVSDWYFSWHSGLRWDFSPSLTLKGNLSKGVRIPRLSEKFGDRGWFIGNAELKEEEAINLDLEVSLVLNPVVLNMAFFQRWLDEAIVASYDSRGVGRFENISQAEIQGVEFDASYAPLEWLTLVGRSTFQHTENTSGILDQQGNQLAGHYEQAHYLSGSVHYADWVFRSELEFQVGGYYDSAAAVAIPDKTQANLSLQWQPGYLSGSVFSVQVRNITDESFEAFNGYPSPGRHYLFTYNQSL